MDYQGFMVLIGHPHQPVSRDGRVTLRWATKVRGNKNEALADADKLKEAFEKKYARVIRAHFSNIDTGFVRVLPGMRYPLPLWRDGIRKQLAKADHIAASKGRR